MAGPQASESFLNLLLRSRGRSGLTQREVADRLGVHRRSVQEWENGASYPSPERLEGLIRVLLEAGGLSAGREAEEAQGLWAAVQHEAPRMHAPFDQAWFARLLAEHATPAGAPAPSDGVRATRPAEGLGHVSEVGPAERRQDWGEAPDTSSFIGRTAELQTLRSWVLDERCRLVAVLGMGGIGKTSLAAKLSQAVAPSFERVYWRSLRDAPPPSDWLAGAIGFLSDHQVVPPASESERLTTVLQLLRERRCLLVLDDFRTVLEPGAAAGSYRAGLEGYGRLLQAVATAAHQSCLLLTSREAPAEVAVLGGAAVRSLALGGLGVDEVQTLLAAKRLAGTREQWAELVAHFGGNGLALKLVGERIRELFGGDLGSFLAEPGATSVFGGIRRLLAEQLERSSAPEQQVLHALAVEREPVTLRELLATVGSRVGRGAVLEAVEALRRSSLVERAETPGAAAFTLQPVVLEYVTERLVEAVAEEIEHSQPVLLVEQPLIQAQAKEYVRQSQERLIGGPLLQRVQAGHGEAGTEQRLLGLLEDWRGRPAAEQGYGPGSVVNLLRLLRGNLRGLDLSRLAIRQAYMADVDAQGASLADAHLAETVLAEAFTPPGSVVLSGDGAVLAAGTSTGEVWLWRTADRTPQWAVQGHTGVVWRVALSADGHVVASGGGDGTVRLWEADTSRPLATLHGHTGAVWGVAVSTDGHLVASGGTDGVVRLWEADTSRPLATLLGHIGAVYSVALSADGRLLASGGADGTVRLWEADTGRPLATLLGHIGAVYSVALSADGRLLASGGADGTVRLWEADTSRPLATLLGHIGAVHSVALSPEGDLVASGGEDGVVRLWEAGTGGPLAIVQGHTSGIRGVALGAKPHLLASCGADGTVRLWEADTGRPLATLRGQTSVIRGVALSTDGRLVVGGDGDGTVRLWETRTGRALRSLRGHTSGVYGVALSAEGHVVASGGGDGTVRLWEADTSRPLATLHGHTGAVWGVAVSTDGHLVASGGGDGTVRLWEVGTQRLVVILRGHTGVIWGVALSADGQLVASGGEDGTVRLWAASSGRPMATLQGHTGVVWAVAWSADGQLVASGGEDGTVRLWAASSGQPLATLQGHTAAVRGVALSADGQLVVSGGFDRTVRVWAPTRGNCLQALRSERRYERLAITGLTGVTDAQRQALIALGAADQSADGPLPGPARGRPDSQAAASTSGHAGPRLGARS